jgi:hypothetical protein
MAQYRWLQDGFVAGFYYQAGDLASTTNVGGTLPASFIPPGAVDPLDTAAVNGRAHPRSKSDDCNTN